MARCEKCIHFDVCFFSEIDDNIRDSGENPNCVHYIPTAEQEVVTDIFENIHRKRTEYWNTGKYSMFECWCKAEEAVKKEYGLSV